MTDIARRLINVLARAPLRWCDDCLSRELQLSRRQQAQAITGVLEELPAYERGRGACDWCKEPSKTVIEFKGNSNAR
jgi:hypothetical protein